jgi:hypothetical protein
VSQHRKGLTGDGDSLPAEQPISIMSELHDIREDVRAMVRKLDKVYEHVVSEDKPERGLLMRVRDIEKKVGTWAKWTGIVAAILVGLIAEKVFEWFTAPSSPSHVSPPPK